MDRDIFYWMVLLKASSDVTSHIWGIHNLSGNQFQCLTTLIIIMSVFYLIKVYFLGVKTLLLPLSLQALVKSLFVLFM